MNIAQETKAMESDILVRINKFEMETGMAVSSIHNNFKNTEVSCTVKTGLPSIYDVEHWFNDHGSHVVIHPGNYVEMAKKMVAEKAKFDEYALRSDRGDGVDFDTIPPHVSTVEVDF